MCKDHGLGSDCLMETPSGLRFSMENKQIHEHISYFGEVGCIASFVSSLK